LYKFFIQTQNTYYYLKNMAHEIEADFVDDYHNEDLQCQKCTSFKNHGDHGFCSEARAEVPLTGHCDFFKSID